MPDTSKIMAEQLNAPESLYVLTEDVTMLLPPGHKIGHVSIFCYKVHISFKGYSGIQIDVDRKVMTATTELFFVSFEMNLVYGLSLIFRL